MSQENLDLVEDFRGVVEACWELDDERVLVLQHWRGRGKTSGLEVTHMATKAATVFHVLEGKVTKLVVYFEREHAFADLGLSEKDAHADS